MDSVTRNQYKEMSWGQFEQFAKCLAIFVDFSKFRSSFGAPPTEKSSNVAKNEENPSLNLS